MKRIAWLQAGRREPRPFTTAAAAKRAAEAEAERAVAAGWEMTRGSKAAGRYVLEKGGERRAIVVSVVDEDGVELVTDRPPMTCHPRYAARNFSKEDCEA